MLSTNNFPMTVCRFKTIGERIIMQQDGNIKNMLSTNINDVYPKLLIHDQEPMYFHGQKMNWLRYLNTTSRLDNRMIILTSEINSPELDSFCELSGAVPCHWFSNGALSLQWFDSHKMSLLDNIGNALTYKFSCLNRLISHQRSYRPILASYLLKNVKHSWLQLSCSLTDPVTKKHACDVDMDLPAHHRSLLSSFQGQQSPVLLNTLGSESKSGAIDNNSFNTSRFYFDNTFCHIITETLFYGKTLHLTEKSLRPLVNNRPFILAGPPRSLEYLKRYGFKTFDQFWDESYDQIEDPAARLDAIMDLIKNINEMKLSEMSSMLASMREILEHNYDHFFGKFWQILKQELLTNIGSCITELRGQHSPGLTYKGIESMTDQEFDQLIIKKNYADLDDNLLSIMSVCNQRALKIRCASLYHQFLSHQIPGYENMAGKQQLLASLRSLMNK